MYILGFGRAFPANSIDGVRFTSLPIQYINETKNIPIKNALIHALNSPSEIGEAALRGALASAGLVPEDLTYVIGDTATPWETCPSEGQRIAGRLGLKVPSYDVTGIGCALSAALFSLTQWEDFPSLVGWVSSNLLTQVTDFREGTEKDIFGDGAGACVISKDKRAGYEIVDVKFTLNHSSKFEIEQDLFGAIKIKSISTADELREEFKEFVDFDGLVVVPPILKNEFGWIKGKVISHEHGELLGANSCVAMSDLGELPAGGEVLILEKSGGGALGSILLRRVV
jgi:3-oxoacyl-[acyl-carrier-protein] synthase III